MTINALIGLIVGLVSATVLVAGILLYIYYKKRQTYYENKFDPEVKSRLEINIKEKKYRIIDFEVNEEGEPYEKIRVNWIPLKHLQGMLETLEEKNFFNNSIKFILGRKTLREKELYLSKTLGNREKLRYKKSHIVFITPASIIKEEHKIIYMIQRLNFGREVDVELQPKIETFSEKQIYKKMVRNCKDISNPVLVKISAIPSYTKATDPTFPPAELIRMLKVWYGLNNKMVYVSKTYDIYILESVPDKHYRSTTLDNYYKGVFGKDMKQFKLFSPQLIQNINSLKVTPIYVEKVSEYDISFAMVILKMRLSEVEEFKVTSNQYNNIEQRQIIEDKFNKQVVSATKEIRNLSLRFDSETLSGNKVLLRPDISSKNLFFIYNFTASLREDLLRKMEELLNEMPLKRSMFIEMDWLLYWVYMESKVSIKFQIMITYSTAKYGLSFWNEMFLEKVSKYHESPTLLMLDVVPFYEDIINFEAFDRVAFSTYALKQASEDINKDAELAKIKELVKAQKIKLIS